MTEDNETPIDYISKRTSFFDYMEILYKLKIPFYYIILYSKKFIKTFIFNIESEISEIIFNLSQKIFNYYIGGGRSPQKLWRPGESNTVGLWEKEKRELIYNIYNKKK